MSRYVAALVYRKRIGSMARKAILAYCAERANDDGTGVWASKVTMSKEIECSKQTVISTIGQLVAEGLLIEAGRRKTSNGYVVEYDLCIRAIEALEDAIPAPDVTGPILDRSTSLTPRGQAAGPQGVKELDPNRPLTVLEPSNPHTPTPEVRETRTSDAEDDRHSRLSADAKPQPGEQTDEVERGFEIFWKDIWPRHKRKLSRSDCLKAHRDACAGRNKNAERGVTPEELNAAAGRYIASVRDDEYLKGPLPWLRAAGWEPFLETSNSQQRQSERAAKQRSMTDWMEVVR